jgi:hypothetical protein
MQHFVQLGIQLTDSVSDLAYSFVMTVSLITSQLYFYLTIYPSAVDHARPPLPLRQRD